MSPLGWLKQSATNSFVRSVGVLVGGTAFAQVILGLTLPVTTRLYSPEDFNVLAVLTGIISIISVAACLRYDIAVPLPEEKEDAAALVALCLGIAAALAIIIALPIALVPRDVATLIGQPALAPYLWLVPLSTFLAGAYSALQFWYVRSKAFPILARNRIAQAAGSSATQIGFGLAGIAPFGLLLGQAVNSGLGAVRLALRMVRNGELQSGMSRSRILRVAHSYHRFPKFSALEAISNSAAIYLPIIMLGALASGPEAGFLMLGMYAMQVPMSLIGNAVAQVYMSRGPEELRAGRLGEFTVSVLSGLAKTGVGPLIFAGIVAPKAFALVFGPEWLRAGELVMWMTPWFILQFLVTPISLALHITNRLATALALQLSGLVLRPASILIALQLSVGHISEAYAVSGAVFYLIYLIVVIRCTKSSVLGSTIAIFRAAPIWLGWALLGIAVSFGLGLLPI